MGFSWKQFKVSRFYGVDIKTNKTDIQDGKAVDVKNVYQEDNGVITKRKGLDLMFTSDEASGSVEIDEIGVCTLLGTKYYFKFSGGKFHYSLTLTGVYTTLSPSPVIGTAIWYAVADDKLFFVDGTNDLRYFNGSAISTSDIYDRPTVAATGGAGTGFDYVYTVDNGLGQSPAVSTANLNKGSAATMTIAGNVGPLTLVVGDKIRVYSKATGVVSGYFNVTTTSGSNANGTYGSDELGGYYQITSTTASYTVTTVALAAGQIQLYTELGIAANTGAPTALDGITNHYGRLVGWKGSVVSNSKSTNVHSWPVNSSTRGEVWELGFREGDGEEITVCVSYRESLYVGKPSNILVLGGVGPDDTGGNAYSARRLETNGNGIIAGKSATVIGEDEESFIIFLSRNDFYATNGQNPQRIGIDISPFIQSLSVGALQNACGVHHKRDNVFVCFVGAEGSRRACVFDVAKDKHGYIGWFFWYDINAKCIAWDDTRYLVGTYDGVALYERLAYTAQDYIDPQVEFVANASFDGATNVITVVSTYEDGDTVRFRSTGTLPTNITANQSYFVINATSTTIQISATSGGVAIDFSGGSGTHAIVRNIGIDAYYTTNWIKFDTATKVKKLGRLGVLLNAVATEINLTVTTGYDWVNSYGDDRVIEVTSSHLWNDGIWGSFIWGGGFQSAVRNVSIPRRKVRSISYKFSNSEIAQDFNLQGIEQNFDIIRNRGEQS